MDDRVSVSLERMNEYSQCIVPTHVAEICTDVLDEQQRSSVFQH